VLIDNFAYLFSPTAFHMTDTCIARLNEKFFDCSYGNLLRLSRRNHARLLRCENEASTGQGPWRILKALSDLAISRPEFYLVVPPNKSDIYYDWSSTPSIPKADAGCLARPATRYGYIDLETTIPQTLESGFQDSITRTIIN